jgi:hypothetical protein
MKGKYVIFISKKMIISLLETVFKYSTYFFKKPSFYELLLKISIKTQ